MLFLYESVPTGRGIFAQVRTGKKLKRPFAYTGQCGLPKQTTL